MAYPLPRPRKLVLRQSRSAGEDGRMAEIVLVRHGQTEWSATGRHTSYTDVPLTPDGERQAQLVGKALVGRGFVAVRGRSSGAGTLRWPGAAAPRAGWTAPRSSGWSRWRRYGSPAAAVPGHPGSSPGPGAGRSPPPPPSSRTRSR